MRTAIVGGGAAGFFLAVNLKEMMPEMDVTIFERSSRVLAKVEVSGGGRCNCTNSFAQVSDLSQVYPRGHRLMKRLFNVFDQEDAYQWFERHGVPLVTQDDECVFPQAQDSHAVINCFLSLARHHHINICTGKKIQSLDELAGYDYVAVTTGGSPKGEGLRWLAALGHEIEAPVPSLFTFSVADDKLHALQGLVVEEAAALIPGTKYRAEGPLLITHWGLSGPAVLKLSSYAARILAERDYRADIMVRWLRGDREEIADKLRDLAAGAWGKQLHNVYPRELNGRLWLHLLRRAKLDGGMRWGALGDRERGRLVNVLAGDMYHVVGKNRFKEEFVTCGGVALSCLKYDTLETKSHRGLFFAGEAMDVDAVTGGFNLQAAWTTGYVAAQGAAGD